MRSWVQVLQTGSPRNVGKYCVHETQSDQTLPQTLRKWELRALYKIHQIPKRRLIMHRLLVNVRHINFVQYQHFVFLTMALRGLLSI
jgi:hypothetical protein